MPERVHKLLRAGPLFYSSRLAAMLARWQCYQLKSSAWHLLGSMRPWSPPGEDTGLVNKMLRQRACRKSGGRLPCIRLFLLPDCRL